jgi:glycosyltransferase involved in cell wall biosynthesis
MELVRERGLQEAVRYLGVRSLDQIVEAIDDCDVGIIPNRRSVFTEINMPTRIFEYLARGKPVIAPLTAGIQDYFSSDELLFFEL